jgi:hypothetical protein
MASASLLFGFVFLLVVVGGEMLISHSNEKSQLAF